MRLAVSLALLALCGCGATVGDACTTTTECSGATCLNRDFTPGGYCTLACSLTDANSCPAGTLCVRDALARGSPGCMRVCRDGRDCRDGYLCKTQKDSADTLCVGPAGI